MTRRRLAFAALLAGFVGSIAVWAVAYTAGMFMADLAAEVAMIAVLVAGEGLHRTAHARRSARNQRHVSI